MKTFLVNKNSWHYKMNIDMVKTNESLKRDDYAERYVQSKDNFCSYWRMTLSSLSKAAIVLSLIAALLVGFLYVMYKVVSGFIYDPSTTLVLTGIVIAFLAFVIGIAFFSDWIAKRKRIKLNKILHGGHTETSLAKAKYSSWKNGICVKVEFKE